MKIVFNETEKKVFKYIRSKCHNLVDNFVPVYEGSLSTWPMYYEKLPSEKVLDKFKAQVEFKRNKKGGK